MASPQGNQVDFVRPMLAPPPPKIYQSPVTVYGFVQRRIADLEMIKDAPRSSTSHAVIRQPKWCPPPEGWVKLNVDGGVGKSRPRGAAAVVCRDAAGVYLGSSARILDGCTDPATLEALACNEALALAADLNLHRIVIACDSVGVVNNINEGSLCHYSAILSEIREKRKAFAEVHIIHEGRASNSEAHNFVKSVLTLVHGRYVWLLQPRDIAVGGSSHCCCSVGLSSSALSAIWRCSLPICGPSGACSSAGRFYY